MVYKLDEEHDLQKELELRYSKYQSNSFTHQKFIEAGFQRILEKLEIPVPFGIHLLAEMAVRKRTKISAIVGILSRHFKSEENPYQTTADFITYILKCNLIGYDTERDELVVAYELDDDSTAKLEQFQYPLPMVEPPVHVTNNRQTGYVTIQGSLLLQDNHHNNDICLEHINRVNKQALSINENVVAFIQNQWKNITAPKAGESREDYDKRRKNYLKYTKGAYAVMQLITMHANEFWLTHKYDKRGRTYCQGYHVNYQGNDWNKACVQFAYGERLNQ